jgi:hypothetical protein
MRPDHRAQLAAAIARFEANIRRLVREVRPQDLDRLLTTLDPTRAHGVAVAMAMARTRNQAAAPRRQPAARARQAAAGAPARQAAAGAPARQAVTRRTRKVDAAAKPHVEPTVSESVIAPPAITTSAATQISTEPVKTDPADTAAATTAVARAEPASGSGGKRVRWTREAIIEELARWMVTGTTTDSSFVKRHGPPGLVSAALRIFGRFDAALNVAGLHVAKLYPDGPPAR